MPLDNNDGNGFDKQSRLADLIAKRAAEGSVAGPAIVTVQPAHPNLRYETASDSFINLDSGVRIAATDVEVQAAAEEEAADDEGVLIPDDGRNLQASINAIKTEYDRIKVKFDAHTFDPATGEKLFEYGPAEREVMQRQLEQLQASGEWEWKQAEKLARQRIRLREAAGRAAVEAVAREQRVAAMTDEAIERLEAEAAAEEIVRRRRNAG